MLFKTVIERIRKIVLAQDRAVAICVLVLFVFDLR